MTRYVDFESLIQDFVDYSIQSGLLRSYMKKTPSARHAVNQVPKWKGCA